ncbi:MAG TPA: hypothetical protein PK289_01265 [Bacteroidia bacterium]|nr:hypothetical protein [Bacteroidia bacterium]
MKNKVAIIVYHKNANKIYPEHWIEQFRKSIYDQTYDKFDIMEINYGMDDFRIFTDSSFLCLKKDSFVDVMNEMISACFKLGYKYVFNTNVDDFYSPIRVEKQLEALEAGYDLVSSNFALVDTSGGIMNTHEFQNLSINAELNKDHNIICHPVVAYSKKFWANNRYVPGEVPFEDLKLWQRSIADNKFIILPDTLCYHRIHGNMVSGENTNRNEII